MCVSVLVTLRVWAMYVEMEVDSPMGSEGVLNIMHSLSLYCL